MVSTHTHYEKGCGSGDSNVGLFIPNGEISLPAASIAKKEFEENLDWMEKFLESLPRNIQLAPHGKTTMMPKLFQKVAEKPHTWGITTATATHTRVAFTHGIKKVIMGNQLIGARNMEIISEIQSEDPDFEYYCLVDSPEQVELLGKFFASKQQQIRVLLEYGCEGGRTGLRNCEQEEKILKTLEKWNDVVLLCGVEFFEGISSDEKVVREIIKNACDGTARLARDNVFMANQVIVSGGGSCWFDLVCEALVKLAEDNGNVSFNLIIRPGCYMIHDSGTYQAISDRIEEKNIIPWVLRPCVKIWAQVQSVPEKELAIIGFGKRDAAMDLGYPLPSVICKGRDSRALKKISGNYDWKIFRMMDQHSFMKISEGDDINVGDIIGFDIYHPCTTFDKWRRMHFVDEELIVLETFETYF